MKKTKIIKKERENKCSCCGSTDYYAKRKKTKGKDYVLCANCCHIFKAYDYGDDKERIIRYKDERKYLDEEFNNKNLEENERYKLYLESDVWKKIRRSFLIKKKFKCLCCGKIADCPSHWDSPAYYGNEKKWQISVLCKKCHGYIHKNYIKKIQKIKYLEEKKAKKEVSVLIKLCKKDRIENDKMFGKCVGYDKSENRVVWGGGKVLTYKKNKKKPIVCSDTFKEDELYEEFYNIVSK